MLGSSFINSPSLSAIGGELCRKLAVALAEAIRRGSDRKDEGVSHLQ